MSRVYFRAKFAVFAFLGGVFVPICTVLSRYLITCGFFPLALLGIILFAGGPISLGFLLKHHFQYQLNRYIEEGKRHAEIKFPVVLLYFITCLAGMVCGYFLFPETCWQ